MAQRSRFTKEFKLDALRLWKASDRPAATVARELGLRRNPSYKGQTKLEGHGEAAVPGAGKRPALAPERQRLRREKARLREAGDIVTKAAAFFVRESPSNSPSATPSAPSTDWPGSGPSGPSAAAATMPGATGQ